MRSVSQKLMCVVLAAFLVLGGLACLPLPELAQSVFAPLTAFASGTAATGTTATGTTARPGIEGNYLGGSGGGGGGSGQNTYASTGLAAGAAPGAINASQAARGARDAVAAALSAGSSTAAVRFVNPGNITLGTLQAMAASARDGVQVRINADSMTRNGSTESVGVRISLDPARSTKDLILTASTDNRKASDITAHFARSFANSITTVSFGQQGDFGQDVEVAVKTTVTDASGIVLYSYDSVANQYTVIPNPGCWIDVNGYLHFTTSVAGDIIISTGELTPKA